jgi:hypothetical protein
MTGAGVLYLPGFQCWTLPEQKAGLRDGTGLLFFPSLTTGIRPRYAETISDYSFYWELSSGALQNSTSVWGQNSRLDDVRTTGEDPGYWRQ